MDRLKRKLPAIKIAAPPTTPRKLQKYMVFGNAIWKKGELYSFLGIGEQQLHSLFHKQQQQNRPIKKINQPMKQRDPSPKPGYEKIIRSPIYDCASGFKLNPK
mmetsp:Transcript_17711/g.35341  ORF Transcript_17711/g.35341 Transcript_17711/m.35341 type:complete len:103 (+) Transcript_17711:1975-2283(+)